MGLHLTCNQARKKRVFDSPRGHQIYMAKKKPKQETKKADTSIQRSEVNHTTAQHSTTKEVQYASDTRIKASPLAKAMAREKGIDISQIHGSGDNGRVIRSDIENFKPGTSPSQTIVASGTEGYRDEPISQMRKTIARRLLESKTGAPHFYLHIEVDMDNAIASRNAINALPETKVSFNDMIIRACSAALRRHLKVNVSWLGDKIRYYSHIHIGVAVAVEDGLLVPVIRFADQKSFSQISTEVKSLSQRARDKKLQPADWEGNTFTVSNLGMFGIDNFNAIVNPPQSCILAVGQGVEKPVVINGDIAIATIMNVTLSSDHRSVDGAVGAEFLQALRNYIENPILMLI